MGINLNFMTTNVKQFFDIEVWFRFVIGGEQEKDFEIHKIEASNVQEAVNKAADLYNTHKAIPFKYLFEGKEYLPTNFVKADLFALTSPDLYDTRSLKAL